jgi:hypothetical protein
MIRLVFWGVVGTVAAAVVVVVGEIVDVAVAGVGVVAVGVVAPLPPPAP